MSVIIDGTNGLTFPNSTVQTAAGAPLATPSFTSTIGVGAATASASGAGVSFPATQNPSSDANTLDDYEEGTVTYPLILGGSTITSGYGTNQCKYTKIGNTVNCFYNMDYTGSSGVVTITLPFTVGSTQNNIIIMSNYSNQYGYALQCLYLNSSSATAQLCTGIDPNTAFNLAAGNRLYIRATFIYQTA